MGFLKNPRRKPVLFSTQKITGIGIVSSLFHCKYLVILNVLIPGNCLELSNTKCEWISN